MSDPSNSCIERFVTGKGPSEHGRQWDGGTPMDFGFRLSDIEDRVSNFGRERSDRTTRPQ